MTPGKGERGNMLLGYENDGMGSSSIAGCLMYAFAPDPGILLCWVVRTSMSMLLILGIV